MDQTWSMLTWSMLKFGQCSHYSKCMLQNIILTICTFSPTFITSITTSFCILNYAYNFPKFEHIKVSSSLVTKKSRFPCKRPLRYPLKDIGFNVPDIIPNQRLKDRSTLMAHCQIMYRSVDPPPKISINATDFCMKLLKYKAFSLLNICVSRKSCNNHV